MSSDSGAPSTDGEGLPKKALLGRHILVTRPAGQAESLARRIEEEGGVALRVPVMAIEDVVDMSPLRAMAERLQDIDFAAFVSVNAVERALPVLLSRHTWPVNVRALAVGVSTENALARFHIDSVIAPREHFDSEALLALPELAREQVSGKRVVIFRGDGGRELLGDTLKDRDAHVEYVACYRRVRPTQDLRPIAKMAQDATLSAMTFTSSEGVRNFVEMTGVACRQEFFKIPVFVPHARIAEEARRLGFTQVMHTAPADDGIMEALIRFFRRG